MGDYLMFNNNPPFEVNILRCSGCTKAITELEVFPKGVCVTCYEKSLNGEMPEFPDFTKALSK